MKFTTRSRRVGAVVIVLFAMTTAFFISAALTPSPRGSAVTVAVTRPPRPRPTTTLRSPLALTPHRMSLNAAPVAVPVVVEIPSIHVSSNLLAVGMTAAHVMAAPEGGANSPFWGDTFWYRGGSVPGAVGTATIAGHIDNRYGQYAVFGQLSKLVKGDLILIRYTQRGFTERFVVTSTHAYTLAQTTTKRVLNLIYGTGPPAGRPAKPSADGLAHLSLITCAGTWDYAIATHNERLVVTAVRIR